MSLFKRKLRSALYILLIVLASIGVGLIGGIPIPILYRKEKTEIKSELPEEEEEEEEEDTSM